MTTRKDSAKWREMLKPLILALIALASATTAYVKSHSEVSEGSERNAVSMAKMETRIELIEFSLGLFFAPLGLPPFLPFSALVGLGRLPIICEWIERTSASVRIFPQCGHLAGIGFSRFT